MNTYIKPWWQTLKDIGEFRRRLEDLTEDELLSLHSEIKAGAAVTQTQLTARGNTDPEWRKRALMAVGFLAEKRTIVGNEIRRRRTVRKPSDDALNEARCRLDADDVHGALDSLLRWFEEK